MEHLEPQHADIMVALMDFHQRGLFTDFTVQLKEGPAQVSGVLMAAMSPVFRNMLTLDMAETRRSEVAMRHITTDVWMCIMQFYFGTQKLVSAENVVEVLELSHMYELHRLEQYCLDFLQSSCSPENCLVIKRICTLYGYEDLGREATRVMADNFSAVCKSEEFVGLEKADLLQLLEKEALVTNEDDLCQTLLTWMEARDATADTCTELFRYLRLESISDACLADQVVCNGVLGGIPAAQSKIQQEVSRRMKATVKQTPVERQKRPPHSSSRSLVVIGKNAHSDLYIYVWSFGEKKWTCFEGPPQEVNDCFSAALYNDSSIVVTGGIDSNETHLFVLESRTWSAGPDLVQGRGRHGMAVVRDKVYVVAGYHTYSPLSSIEQYSEACRQWTPTGDLLIATSDCGVAAFRDTILVVGGGEGSKEAGRLVQTFDLETGSAALLEVFLPRPMFGVHTASIGDTFFFVGNGGDLVWVSETREGELQVTAHMCLSGFVEETTWYGFHVTWGGGVLVIGGNDGMSVDCWNLEGERTENEDVADLPQVLDVFASFEGDIPDS